MGLPFYPIDLREDFRREVKDRFARAYADGLTPNPCIDCNRRIKFGRMIERAEELGFDCIATGHYARVQRDANGRCLLLRAVDESKDQSYVLYVLTQQQLARVLLPLGEYTKPQIREIAREQGFISADRPDSQDICFIPDGDYTAFLQRERGICCDAGDFLDAEGRVLGRHKGYLSYTVGQRRGLGVSGPASYYVIDKDARKNTVTLGFLPQLMAHGLEADDVNFIAFDRLDAPLEVTVKSGYRQKPFAARLHPLAEDKVYVEFAEPQRAVAAGQAAVFYDGEVVLGGGRITRHLR